MELPLLSLTSTSAASFCSKTSLCEFAAGGSKRLHDGGRVCVRRVTASAEQRSSEGINGGREAETGGGRRFTSPAMQVTTLNTSFGEAEYPVWEKIGAVVRLSYGIGIYGGMALAGRFICSMIGVDSMGGFELNLDAIVQGLGYAAPPIMALLFILDDEVVKVSPHARAIRDVEDEELRSFFYGMSPLQFILIVTASSLGEELFYRAAVQGSLAEIFLKGTDLVTDVRGMASVSGVLPPFVPFAQAFAAVITAALTGSLYYVAASPKDPAYVVAPVLQSRSGHEDMKKLFAENFRKTLVTGGTQDVKKPYTWIPTFLTVQSFWLTTTPMAQSHEIIKTNVVYETGELFELGIQLSYLLLLLGFLGIGTFFVIRQVLVRRELDLSAKELQEQVRSGDASATELFELGAVMLRRKIYPAATKYLVQAIEKWDGDDQDLAQVYNALGVSYVRDGKLAKGITMFETAVKLQPGYVTAWNNLGDAYEQKKDFKAALNAFEEVLLFDPNNKVAQPRRDTLKEQVKLYRDVPVKTKER